MTSSQALKAWCARVDAALAANEQQMRKILERKTQKGMQ